MSDEATIELSPGSQIRVESSSSGDEPVFSTGEFLAYTVIASDQSLAVRLGDDHGEDAGLVRIIPVGAVQRIDVLELAEEEDDEEDVTPFYG